MSDMLKRFEELAAEKKKKNTAKDESETKQVYNTNSVDDRAGEREALMAARNRVAAQQKRRSAAVGRPKKKEAEKNKRIDISLAPLVIERLELQAKNMGLSKSAYIAYLINNDGSSKLSEIDFDYVESVKANAHTSIVEDEIVVTPTDFINEVKEHNPDISEIEINDEQADTSMLKDGLHETFYDDGSLKSKFLTKDGEKDGNFYEYWQNDYIKVEGKYVNGHKHGTWYSYFDNGYLKLKGNYENGQRQGLWVENFENGTIWREINYINNKKNGVETLYDPDGVKIKEENYKHGQLIDVQLLTNDEFNIDVTKEISEEYSNGKTRKNGKIVNGQREGQWCWYYPNGSLWIDASYSEGLYNGTYKKYYESGEIKFIGNYENGLMTGEWNFFDDEGNIVKTKLYSQK